jgi:hypothetical protein
MMLAPGRGDSRRARDSFSLKVSDSSVIFEVEGVEQSLLTLRLTTHHPDALRAWMKLVEQAGLEPQ